MKYNVTFHYSGSITHTVEAKDEREAYDKLQKYVDSLSDLEFFNEAEFDYNGSDIEEARDEDEVEIS